ncbi:MAG: hypothetical protein U9N85_12410 [Bacteroidota bacterium]|nr:hypothetical protein [Bacteroidota bacterium]
MKNIQQNTNETDFLVIPNPIYDVVFKYLMEDNQSAKIILSTLINEKIKKLTFEPLSHTEKIQDPKTDKIIKLFHLDFTAIIEKPNGKEELIMIEIQKANKANDIFRFKRYISANFQRKQEEEIINPRTQAVEKINKPIRLIPIFILNFRIENEVNDLIIKTNREKIGIFKKKSLKNDNEFIDNLSFDIWVIQLPNLKNIEKKDYENDDYKTKLYLLLKLFDQEAQNKNNKHRLLIIKKLFPKFLERVINRLKSADADNPDLEEQMNAEDEYLAELIKRDNEISYFKQVLEKTTGELEKTTGELEHERELRKQKDKVLGEKDKIIIEYAKTLKDKGKPTEEIKKLTNLSKEVIDSL